MGGTAGAVVGGASTASGAGRQLAARLVRLARRSSAGQLRHSAASSTAMIITEIMSACAWPIGIDFDIFGARDISC
jgi:hypothetical protein